MSQLETLILGVIMAASCDNDVGFSDRLNYTAWCDFWASAERTWNAHARSFGWPFHHSDGWHAL